mmetsp:Transcript_145567/g.363030  ORF Transcript_145567/g.363030 Transcript_145567/m.363030 type:complete len:224 (-) Transcript_145567:26-697(-)
MPFAQPPLNTNAQGLHVPRSWAWEPIEGQAGRKPDAQSACFVGHAEVLSIETPWLGASSMGLGHCAPAAVIHAGEPSLFGEAPPSVVARSIVSAVLISEVTSASANDGVGPRRALLRSISPGMYKALLVSGSTLPGVGSDPSLRNAEATRGTVVRQTRLSLPTPPKQGPTMFPETCVLRMVTSFDESASLVQGKAIRTASSRCGGWIETCAAMVSSADPARSL